MEGANFTPNLHYVWERALYWLNRRLIGSQSQSGNFEQEINTLPPPRFETQAAQAIV
jgi:hypothetical protein